MSRQCDPYIGTLLLSIHFLGQYPLLSLSIASPPILQSIGFHPRGQDFKSQPKYLESVNHLSVEAVWKMY